MDAGFSKSANSSAIRRLGLQMVLSEGFDRIEWYGKGPHWEALHDYELDNIRKRKYT